MKKKIFRAIIATLLVFIFLSADNAVIYAAVTATSVKLNTSSISLAVVNKTIIDKKTYNNTYQLSATVSPSNTTNKTISWSSSNSNVATVSSSGKVTAKASGTATITAKTSNGKTATCKVDVKLNTNSTSGIARFNKSVVNSTVWPITTINLYKESTLKTKTGTITALTEAIITDKNDATNAANYTFKIKTASGTTGWVSNQNLLINLPDVRDDIQYNITNSYKSIFKIGSKGTNNSQTGKTSYTSGYVGLSEITDKKLYTYDNYDANQSNGKVWNSKLGREEYVCPVLYELALKIGEAQNKAIQNGYYLKIYDGYRPQNVCDKFWSAGLKAIGGKNGATTTYNMKSWSNRSASEKKASCLTGGGYYTDASNSAIPKVYVNKNLMTISWSIAAGISDHARGKAVDLTMVYKDNTSKEISTQSDMHDLSLNSLTIYNNRAANDLKGIMTSTGLQTLLSEWWHFNLSGNGSGSYAKGQVSFTNLSDFTASVSYSPNTTWSSKNVTVKVTANRPIKTKPSGWSYVANTNNRTIQKTYSSTTNAETISIKDYKNREKKVSIKKIQIDKTAPTVTVSGNTSSWTNKEVTLTVSATDNSGGSGIAGYSFDGGKTYSTTKTKKYTSSANNVNIWVKDNAGNITKKTQTIKIDKTKPTLTISASKGLEGKEWVNTSSQTSYITLNPKDTGGSALVDSYEVSTDNKNWTTKTTKSSSKLVYKITKNETVYFKVKDKAGNYSSTVTAKITKVDNNKPTINSVTASKGVLKISATDTGSGLSKYTIDGKTWIDWPAGKSEVQINKEGATIAANAIKVKDAVGNVASWNKQVTIGVVTKFSAGINYSTTEKTNQKVYATITANKKIDKSSVPSGWTLSNDKLKIYKTYNSNTVSTGESYTLKAEETGETTTVIVKITNIDTDVPSVQVVVNPDTWAKEATITVNAEDENGIAGYSFNGGSYTTNNTYKVTNNGKITIRVKDKLGNVNEVIQEIKNIDKTAPIINVSEPEYSSDMQTAVITINAEDNETGLKEYSTDGGKTWESWPEEHENVKIEYVSDTTIKAGLIQVKDNSDNIAKNKNSIYIKDIDKSELELGYPVYSTKQPTNQSVTVTIRANKAIIAPEGWTLIEGNNKGITKTYNTNTEGEGEEVEVEDANTGKKVKLSEKIKIENIDKVAPVVSEDDIKYETQANGSVKVTVKADKELEAITNAKNGLGVRWNISEEDPSTIIAVFKVSKNGEITVQDKAENTVKVAINVTVEQSAESLNPQVIYKEIVGDTEVDLDDESVTKNNVKVIITANRKVEDVEGWAKSSDGKILEKTYDNYVEGETITLVDSANTDYSEDVLISVNIDKEAPTITSVTGNPEDWVKSATLTVDATDNKNQIAGYSFNGGEYTSRRTYAITQNGEVKIKVKDIAGNESEEYTVTVTYIDNTAPIINDEDIIKTVSSDKQKVILEVNAEDEENGSGIAKYSFDKGITWQDSNTYEYDYSQTIQAGVIQVKDNSGNIGIYNKTINIEGIDNTIFKITKINYSTKSPTKDNVIVTINANKQIKEVTDSSGWVLSEDKMSISKEFTENTSEEGESVTIADVSTGATVTSSAIIVNNIDREAPVINDDSITYKQISSSKVQVVITANESVQNIDGWNLNDNSVLTKMYYDNTDENGEKVIVKDLAGNEKEVTINVNTIVNEEQDEEKRFNIDITSNPATITTDPVKVTITVDREVVLSEESKDLGWVLLEDGKTLEKTYTENNSEEIVLIDAEDNTYKENLYINVDNIDKNAPGISVEYERLEEDKVKVTMVSNKELKELVDWELSEDKFELSRIYEEDTEEIVKIKDTMNNEQEVVINVKIDNLNVIGEGIVKTIKYSDNSFTDDNVTITLTLNEEIKPVDGWELTEGADGEKQLKKKVSKNYNDTITVVSVEDDEYEEDVQVNVSNIISIGDINGDGKVNVPDVLLLKRHFIAGENESWKLEGGQFKAADINKDGKVNITDLFLMKRKFMKK